MLTRQGSIKIEKSTLRSMRKFSGSEEMGKMTSISLHALDYQNRKVLEDSAVGDDKIYKAALVAGKGIQTKMVVEVSGLRKPPKY